MKKNTFITLIIILIFANSISFSQTTLEAGDIAIVAFAFDNPDELSFLCLRSIESGTVIYFTDNGWKSDNTWRANEGVHTWTAGQFYSTGAVINVDLSGPALAGSGDQIIAFQGSGTTDNSATMIFALNSEQTGWQSDATNANTSALPNGLTNGTNAIAIDEVDNGYYSGSTSGTTGTILSAICNQSNWTTNNTRTSHDPSDDGPSSFNITVSISGSAGFRMLSAPVSDGTYTDLLSDLWTQGMTGSDAAEASGDNVWIWTVGSGGAGSWSVVSNLGNTMTAGEGILVYAFADNNNDGTDDLPVSLSVSGTESSGDVRYPAIGTIDDTRYGFAGNPYYQTIDWDDVAKTNVSATVYVYDDAKSGGAGYISWNGSSGDVSNGLIAPFQGFVVTASGGAGYITIQEADKSSTAGTFYRMLDEVIEGSSYLEFSTAEGGYSKSWLSFRQDGEIGSDDRDAKKLMPLMASSRLVSLTHNEENSLDINNLPYSHEGTISIPLDVMSLSIEDNNYVTSTTEVSMNWNLDDLPDHIELTLLDNITGDITYLNQEMSHSFTTESKGSFGATYDNAVSIYPTVGESRFTLNVTYSALDNHPIKVTPSEYALNPVYPNPFNPSTTIQFNTPELSRVELQVFDVKGALVETLLNQLMVSGQHQYTWQPKSLPTGTYFLKLITNNQTFTQKVTYVK